jgi:hypothetical protein
VPTPKALPKPEETWRPSRLIPTTGIGGQDEQEERATSSLLAVMQAVPQFGRALLRHLGAPAGRITTYTEIRFQDVDEKLAIPDGAIVVERGATRWVCLVEVKTSGAALRVDQILRYLDLTRANRFDAVLTISNQITASPSELPFSLDARRLKSTSVRHLSWWQVMTEAQVEYRHNRVADPDQAWILGELIAYLDHERAGAGGFDDMGDKWVGVRDGARTGSLRAQDAGVREITGRWEQFVQFLALGLTQDLGRQVEPVWPRNLDPEARLDQGIRRLAELGKLAALVRVPDAAAVIELEADLRARLFTTSVELVAPREGRPRTRIAWVVRQLKDAPDTIQLEARYPNVKDTISAPLRLAREKPDALLLSADPKREPRAFRVSLSKDLGTKRGKGQGSFVQESRQQAIEFYRTTVQQLKAWTPAAPKLPVRPAAASASVDATPTPPDFGSPDERDFGEAVLPK